MGKIIIWPVILILLAFGFLYTQGRLDQISTALSQKAGAVFPQLVGHSQTCGEDCKKIISEEVGKAIATISGKPKVQADVQPQVQSQTAYISLDGAVSTTSTDWVDAPGVEVSFDYAQDFSVVSKVSWEASLKVANGNGQAYARLFDVTHKIAVSGSEISTTNNADFQRVTSGNLNLWAGRNTYLVQLKSLNSFEVGYTGGRIRISH